MMPRHVVSTTLDIVVNRNTELLVERLLDGRNLDESIPEVVSQLVSKLRELTSPIQRPRQLPSTAPRIKLDDHLNRVVNSLPLVKVDGSDLNTLRDLPGNRFVVLFDMLSNLPWLADVAIGSPRYVYPLNGARLHHSEA